MVEIKITSATGFNGPVELVVADEEKPQGQPPKRPALRLVQPAD